MRIGVVNDRNGVNGVNGVDGVDGAIGQEEERSEYVCDVAERSRT
jgi:hypothetical protein